MIALLLWPSQVERERLVRLGVLRLTMLMGIVFDVSPIAKFAIPLMIPKSAPMAVTV